ncbi:MAG: [FeFe] hydrogenase H-cluster radical SAM maturase HydE [Bacteroidota bacterium]|nr:[FeFe] hydrogenase H-cluster radical SAM maturase HydE [Bacteroidota bacterium]
MPTSRYLALLEAPFPEREDVIALLSPSSDEEKAALFARAHAVRRETVGGHVHIRGIIEISNRCSNNCLYCGLRRGNTALARYLMRPEEILACAKTITDAGVRTIVLQSGEDRRADAHEIADIIREIKARTDAAVTLSLGERDRETYRLWREAGADRYLLKHETANRSLFARLRPSTDFDVRVRCLRDLAELGYQVGTGNMIGLPGQSLADIADDILLCRELAADMCPFGPFIPSPDTPLSHAAAGSVELSLLTIAVARIVLRTVHIPANTSLGTLDPDAQRRALLCGANVIMPNFTPYRYRVHYRIYPKTLRETPPLEGLHRALEIIRAAGCTPATDRGDSVRHIPPA